MNTLTVPKIKDLVNKPKEQYKDLFKTMQQGASTSTSTSTSISSSNSISSSISVSNERVQDIISSKDMTDELSSFLNELKKRVERIIR